MTRNVAETPEARLAARIKRLEAHRAALRAQSRDMADAIEDVEAQIQLLKAKARQGTPAYERARASREARERYERRAHESVRADVKAHRGRAVKPPTEPTRDELLSASMAAQRRYRGRAEETIEASKARVRPKDAPAAATGGAGKSAKARQRRQETLKRAKPATPGARRRLPGART